MAPRATSLSRGGRTLFYGTNAAYDVIAPVGSEKDAVPGATIRSEPAGVNCGWYLGVCPDGPPSTDHRLA